MTPRPLPPPWASGASFQERVTSMSEADLLSHLMHAADYTQESVACVLLEAERRGMELPPALLEGLVRDQRVEAEAHRTASREVSRRLHRLVPWILGLGLAGAGVAAWLVPGAAEPPLGYDPMDTKKHLYDLERFGGRLNIQATMFRAWFSGLWQGRNLPRTLVCLTLLLALGCWWLGRRMTAGEVPPGSPSGE